MQSFWSSFRLDPRLPANAAMRASDADREIVHGLLGEAFADGRLNREEYDERATALFDIRTLGQLPALVADLVAVDEPTTVPAGLTSADLRARGEAKYRREIREAFGTLLFVSAVVWTIWLVTGHDFIWPIFPTAFLAVNLIRASVEKESTIQKEITRIQRKEARRAEAARPEQLPPSTPPQPPLSLDKPPERERPDGLEESE